jgi:hypothetical protein
MDTLDKGMIHSLGKMEEDGVQFHGATPNIHSLKLTYYLLLWCPI